MNLQFRSEVPFESLANHISRRSLDFAHPTVSEAESSGGRLLHCVACTSRNASGMHGKNSRNLDPANHTLFHQLKSTFGGFQKMGVPPVLIHFYRSSI